MNEPVCEDPNIKLFYGVTMRCKAAYSTYDRTLFHTPDWEEACRGSFCARMLEKVGFDKEEDFQWLQKDSNHKKLFKLMYELLYDETATKESVESLKGMISDGQ